MFVVIYQQIAASYARCNQGHKGIWCYYIKVIIMY